MQKSSSNKTKKTSQTKKRSTKRKSKKPKVILSKNKVAVLCGIICALCVAAISLSIIINHESLQIPDPEKALESSRTEVSIVKEKKSESKAEEKIVSKTESKPVPKEEIKPEVKSAPKEEIKAEAKLIQKQEIQAESRTEKNTQVNEDTKPLVKAEKSEIKKEKIKKDNLQVSASSKNKEESAPNTKTPSKSQQTKSQKALPEKTLPQTEIIQKVDVSKASSHNKAKKPGTEKAPSLKNTVKENEKVKVSPLTTASQVQPNGKNSQLASAVSPKQQETIQKAIPKNRFDLPPASNGATIVIVIDDAGRSIENTRRYTSLPMPITIAVLPGLANSRACAEEVRKAGKELILHQPMQSLNHNLDPGPGKITVDMTTYEIAQTIKQNLAELGPGVKGMNNHEGSEVTSNEIKIGAVLEVCQEKGIYFFDSRTTAATKAPQAALERDMKIFEKAGPYLDNDLDRAKMLERMRETLAYANRHGKALVIGHVDKSVNLLPPLLMEMYPEMKAAGYRFATPSNLR